MQLREYKLGDIAEIIPGVSYTPDDITTSGIRILRGGNIQAETVLLKDDDVFLPMSYANNNQLKKYDTIIVSSTGSVDALAKGATIFEDLPNTQIGAFLRIIRPKEEKYAMIISMWCTSPFFRQFMIKKAKGTSINNIRTDFLTDFPIFISEDNNLEHTSKLYLNLESKLLLNRQINQNLEALARQLYDYWFVQFDFPNEEGKPYKSSGGKMVYNPILKREIPEGWEIVTLSSYISKNNTGDWGKDEYFEKCIQVGCVRGADIVTLCNLPTRYIKNNPSKLLQPLDLVIEISGGSPTQATGRSAFITEGVINRNGGAISCSNFCHAFTMKNIKKAPYFFYLWRTFYENDIMFNYEGKTSGLKNFMTDTFLANVWYDVPDNLTNIFYEKIIAIFTQIDNNIAENLSLTKQRDELLPLLMNGQVNFDLSAY